MNDPHQVTVRVQALNGQWEVIGANRRRGVVPESVQLSANEWGSDQCSFALNDQVGAIRSDLAAWTPVEVDVAGQTVWDGRIKETPTQDSANGRTISVQAEGWQYHLDDDVYTAAYVRAGLGEWQDIRGNVLTYLPTFTATPQVNGTTLQWANGTSVTLNDCVGIMIDCGDDPVAWPKRISVDWTQFASVNASIIARCADSPTVMTTAGGGVAGTTFDTAFTTVLGGSGSLTQSGTFATARRYVSVFVVRTGATAVAASDYGVTVNGIRLYTSTTYESANQSILKADTVITDAVTQATDLLSTDTSGIQAGTITVAEFAPGLVSAREAWQAANAYENYDTRIEVGRRPVFRPRPATAIYEIGEWAGADFQDASVNSGQDIYNRALVQGTGPDGVALTVERTATGTMADRRNFRRTKILPISTAITTPIGQRFGDLFLAAHATTPFRGGFQTVGQGGIRQVLGGGSPHPAWLLRDTTQLVRCPVVDADTGDWTHDARMVNVTYDHAGLAATISLDEDREGFDTLVARYALSAGQR